MIVIAGPFKSGKTRLAEFIATSEAATDEPLAERSYELRLPNRPDVDARLCISRYRDRIHYESGKLERVHEPSLKREIRAELVQLSFCSMIIFVLNMRPEHAERNEQSLLKLTQDLKRLRRSVNDRPLLFVGCPDDSDAESVSDPRRGLPSWTREHPLMIVTPDDPATVAALRERLEEALLDR